MTALNPYQVEEDDREIRRYLGNLVCIANIGLRVYTQELLPEDHNIDAELAILNVCFFVFIYFLEDVSCYQTKII